MFNFKKTTEEFFEAPSEALEKTFEEIKKEEMVLISKRPFKLAEEYFNTLGPGLITGAADDDPSGIATYSQTGAQYGFQLMWLSLFTFPFMAMIQEMCARIGIVTGEGLAANIRRSYSRRLLKFITFLLFIANTLNIAADLGAMSAGTQLILPHFSFEFLVAFFAIVSLLLQIFTTYARYAKILKWLTLALFSYVATAFAVKLDWGTVFLHTLIPTIEFTKDQIFLICAILGTTISPYLFFWQKSSAAKQQSRNAKTMSPLANFAACAQMYGRECFSQTSLCSSLSQYQQQRSTQTELQTSHRQAMRQWQFVHSAESLHITSSHSESSEQDFLQCRFLQVRLHTQSRKVLDGSKACTTNSNKLARFMESSSFQ